MARSFVAASSQYLSRAGDDADLSAGDIDFTIACWVRFDSLSAARVWLSKNLTAGNQKGYQLYYALATDRLRFQVSNDGAADVTLDADVFGAPAIDTWYFVVAWHDATANTLNIQVNNGTPDSVAHTTGVFDNTAPFMLGQNGNGAGYHDGRVAEVGFWKRILTSDERALLAKGGSPLALPGSRVAYWPLIGRFSPEIDVVGGFDLTVTGATASPHPRIFYPVRPRAVANETITLVSLAGNLPAMSGSLGLSGQIALAGAEPAASGTLALSGQIAIAGTQPASSGALSLTGKIALAGTEPAPLGALSQKYLIALVGAQPASSGLLALLARIALAGAEPAPSGALGLSAAIALAGNQPASSGEVAPVFVVVLAGTQPAPSGALGLSAVIALAGAQPAPSGALVFTYIIALAGEQPASSGVLTIVTFYKIHGSPELRMGGELRPVGGALKQGQAGLRIVSSDLKLAGSELRRGDDLRF